MTAEDRLVSHRLRAAIWDIDDTLVDTAPSYLTGQHETLSDLGIPASQLPQAVALWNHLLPFFGHTDRSGILRAICIELSRTLPTEAELHAVAAGVRLSWQVGVSAKMGAMQCLTLLHERRVPVGIVSNGDAGPQRVKLAQSGLDGFFTEQRMIFTPTGSPSAKPSPAGLLACVAALGVPPRQACYVGDTATDMIAANLAGMTPVRISATPDSPRFAIERPAHTAVDLHDARRWLAGRISSPVQRHGHNRQPGAGATCKPQPRTMSRPSDPVPTHAPAHDPGRDGF